MQSCAIVLATCAFAHRVRGYALIPNVRPYFQNLLIAQPHMGRIRVFMLHNISLMLSSSLYVKGLTRMWYGCNNEGYMPILAHLNNQC
jgi:hypothetical protein